MQRQSRYTFDRFADWGYGVQCCVWCASLMGPLAVIGGVVLLAFAIKDPAAQMVKTYNHNVESWTEAGGGFILFQTAFMGPAFPVLLTPANGNVTGMATAEEVELIASSGVSLLNNEGEGYETYDQSLFFSGSLPIFGTDASPLWTLAPYYEPSVVVPLTGFRCSSTTITLPCMEISPPPPPIAPSPPPSIAAFFLTNNTVGINPGLGGNFQPSGVNSFALSAGGAAAGTVEPASFGGTAKTGADPFAHRKLLQSTQECTVYYRQMEFLSEITLTATPPESCGGGYCDNNTWTYALAQPCGETYTTVTVPITAAMYESDVEDGFSWCQTWTTSIPPSQVPACTAYLRSSVDPYVVAGSMTNCSFTFDSSSEQYANMGFFFLIPGLAISLVAYFCLEGMCTPRSFGATGSSFAPSGGQPLVANSKGGYDVPPYGATTATELVGRGMVPVNSWGINKQS